MSTQRGSAGMGLPGAMSDKTIATIKATAPVVAPHALAITQHFDKKVFTKMPELFSIFNKTNIDNDIQPKALAASIVAYASNIDNLGPLVVPHGPVDLITNKHCGLNILPEHYPVVHSNLMESIGEVLGDAVTTDVAEGWSEAVLFLAKVMIDQEEGMYSAAEARAGGWRGMKELKVANVEDLTNDVKRFTFQQPDYSGSYDVTAGQFLTLKVDPNGDGLTGPRHYTVTSSAGDPYLQCSVKKLKGGLVSTYLHENVKAGDSVQISPPFGIFTPAKDYDSAVLISAGVGVTPMFSFSKHFGDKTALVAHVDRSAANHPGKDYFDSLGCKKMFRYTSEGGRPQSSEFATAITKEVGIDHGFYLCGSATFMAQIAKALKGVGATSIHYEAFAPQLGGCPVG